jgi:glycerophosphoryl diester phosphodiesterase
MAGESAVEKSEKQGGVATLWRAGHGLVVAHRGASGYAPENTERAFRLAARLGADAVETDIRRTRDGRLVLIHDDTVDRTTDGSGRVRDRTLDEIRRFDAGGWFGPSFAGEGILTFSEGLELFQSLGLGVAFEIKEEDTCSEAAKMVRDHGFVTQSHAVSFLPGAIRAVKEFEPGLSGTIIFHPRGEIFRRNDPAMSIIDVARRAGADGVAVFESKVDRDMVASFRNAGLRFSVLVVDTEEQIRRVLPLEPDAILTDFPDRVRSALDARDRKEEKKE